MLIWQSSAPQASTQIISYISEAAREHKPELVSYISLVIAALAVVVGPLVQRTIASRQMLGVMRQAWINELRKRLSEYIAFCEKTIFAREFDPNLYASLTRIAELKEEIELLLNQKEKPHTDLSEQLEAMGLATVNVARAERENATEENRQKYLAAKQQVRLLAKKIFKSEWERIKGWTQTRRLWRKCFRREKAF